MNFTPCEARWRPAWAVGVFLICLLLSGPPAWAQVGANTGLRGTVTDPTGAAVPGATVTLLRTDTGERRVLTTGENGEWEARLLTPGAYQLVFERTGFKKAVRDGVTVTTAQVGTLNVELEIGPVGQSIEVVANPEMISSASAAVVKTLDRKELENLPTSSRNFSQLLMIETGVSADISELLDNSNSNISPSVNGARTTNNSFVYNGVDTTSLLCCNSRTASSGGSLSRNMAPAPETLEEVKLQTSLYDAATGRNGGGNFMLVSKSGTNEFHGTVYHYFQNDKLMANEFFLNRAGVDRPMLRRNEGGATIGGPIIKNKTFFFGSFQATRARTSFVDSANKILRMPQALTDDRSDAGINAFAQGIWQPKAGAFNPNVINPISRAILKLQYPDGSYLIPSGANGRDCRKTGSQIFSSCQIVSVIPASYSQDQFSANIDHQITQNNRLSGKFFYTNQPSLDPMASSRTLSRFERNRDTRQRTLSLTDTMILGPAMANEFRAGFFRNRNDTRPNPYFTNAEVGITGNPKESVRPDLVTMDIRGERDVGDRFQFGTYAQDIRDVQNTFTFADTLSFTRGRHSLKVGAEFRRHQLNGKLQELMNGRKNFRDWFRFLTVGWRDPSDGNRSRQISDTAVSFGETIRGYRMSDYSGFFADDWKVNSKLTLNLGVSWEYFGFPWEVNGMLSAFDYNQAVVTGYAGDGFIFASNFKPDTVGATQQPGLRIADSKSIISADKNDLMPRFGFAYSPFGGNKLVIRGGYGMFFERTTGAFANSLRQSAPFFREGQIDNQSSYTTWPVDIGAFPIPHFILGFDDGEPQLSLAGSPDEGYEAYEAQMIDPNLATPYTQQWSLNLQWEFKPGWMWEFGYAGTKGTKLLQIYNINRAIDVNTLGFMPRPNVPGGGLSGNYYDVIDDEFVNLKTPPSWCNLSVDPGACVVDPEVRSPLLGFDEDEGVNFLSSNANSIYNSFQTSLQKRYARGYMFKLNYTFSRAIDTFSDESKFQVDHDDTNPKANRGLSDFHRKHRLITSGTWDLPFKRNKLVSGWSLSGIATFQSGTPFSVYDDCCSGYLYPNGNKRPSIATGVTHADLVTSGPINEHLDNYLQKSDYAISGAQFGNLGRNTLVGPDQRRVDLVLSKITPIREGMSLELRGEFFNAFNTVTFREPDSNGKDITQASFGTITRTRGGPRVIQLGLKLRF